MSFDSLDTDTGLDYMSSSVTIVGSDGIATQFEQDLAVEAQKAGITAQVAGVSGIPFNQAANPAMSPAVKVSATLANKL